MTLSDRLNRRRERNANKIEPVKYAMNSLLDRFSETSTWRGLILLATSLGVTIQPDYHEHIIAIGIALVGIINVIRRDKKIPKAEVIDD
jgi:hypothetical protein